MSETRSDRDRASTRTARIIRARTEVTLLCQNLPPGLRPEDNDTGARMSLEQLARRVE